VQQAALVAAVQQPQARVVRAAKALPVVTVWRVRLVVRVALAK
jgi:hypothetical protein